VPKKKLEKDIQREICDWLASRNYFFWRQNTVPVFDKGRFRAMPKYTPKGLPDILCVIDGHFIGLEVKVPDYWKRTDDQMAIQERFGANGASYYLVTSLEEAKKAIANHDNIE
jgi:hypothetical protein